MRHIKIYSIFLKQYIKGLMEYRTDFIIGMVAFLFSQSTGLLFLYIIFQNIPTLLGFTMEQVLLMYGFSLIPKGIDHLLFDNLWLLPQAVRQGRFDRYLLRPVNSLYAFMIERFQPDAFGEILLGSVLMVYALTHQTFSVSVLTMLSLIPVALIGVFAFTSLKLLTASTSFWLKNSYPLMQVTYNLSDFSRYPMVIFPKFIQFILTYMIPFALISYYPAIYILGQIDYVSLLIRISFVVIVLGLCALKVYHLGLSRYESTGS